MSQRLDQALVERGLVRSRAQAKDVLAAGAVRVGGRVEKKASCKVEAEDHLEVTGNVDPYVGRAAHKLLAALDAFPTFAAAVQGSDAVDVGASTGGFTQVLLERGARHVVALDVGHGQLAAPLAGDERVSNLEGCNIRDVISRSDIDGSPFPIVVSDLSFISLALALPNMVFLLAPHGHLIALIKPQFEIGRERLGRTGVVSSREQRRECVMKVLEAARKQGLECHGLAWSPMVGTHGNHEYLVYLRPHGMSGAIDEESLGPLITQLVDQENV